MRGLSFGLACLALLAPPLAARDQDFTPNSDGQIEFVTPTGNIGCLYSPEGAEGYMSAGRDPELACGRKAPTPVTLVMNEKGKVTRITKPQNQDCCTATARLAYGNRWTRGPFDCLSGPTGLHCTGPQGHWFTISRGTIIVK